MGEPPRRFSPRSSGRQRSRPLPGLALAAGLAVVAGSATQVVTTMSAPVAGRTATQNVATANYFPAPLPTGLTCVTDGIAGFYSATLNWTAPPRPAGAAAYRYRVTWLFEGAQKYTFDTANTTTGAFRIRDQLSISEATGKSYVISVRTINPADPTVVSSGYTGWTVYSPTTPSTRCTGDAGVRVENQPWENQLEWSPAVAGSTATGRMFVSMAAELSAGTLAEALPPEEDLGELADVPPPAPTSDASDPTSSGAGPESGADTSSPPTEPEGPASGDDASPSPTDPAGNPADSATGGAGTTQSESAPSPSESPSGPPAPTVSPRLTATLGSGPITVGAVEATLEEVDGQPTVLVSAGGAPVCTVAVPGASAIENSGGTLIVTGTVPDQTVDTSTCALS